MKQKMGMTVSAAAGRNEPVHGQYSGSARVISGKCIGNYLAIVWAISDLCMTNVWVVRGHCLACV